MISTRQFPLSVNSKGVIGLLKFPHPLLGKRTLGPRYAICSSGLLERVHLPDRDTYTAIRADEKLIYMYVFYGQHDTYRST